ncbi:gamma-interferon-inducible lysosomal thiol reductase isoform X6 [Diabrotica virgifera virgifera]|nr:gamma-interferon-inducible lysosomal thiol reductase isoform X7 [Diabrotica virgifera virgifera]XP_050508427.1 gamma-interferon-inducible lysosomal thiol reductase isoform X6 [Diabrotica virgifera virgifera]
MFVSKLVLFFAATVCVSSSVQGADLTLTVFYEGLCPLCYQFIVNQLYPSYPKLADSLKLDLVPYGWSSSIRGNDGKVTFECQHGDDECHVNRIHACVLDQNPSSLDYVTFIYQYLSKTDLRDLNERQELELAQSLLPSSLSWDSVSDCYHGERGTELLLGYEERQAQLNPELPWVPNIRFNGVYDAEVEYQAMVDLTATVCNLLEDNKPDVCKDHVTKTHPKNA